MLDLLAETGKLGCKPVGTPLELCWKGKNTEEDLPNGQRGTKDGKAHLPIPY